MIGIDIGTCNSVAATLLRGKPVLLRSRETSADQGLCFPSFVEFNDDGDLVSVGEQAQRAVGVNPELVVWGTKRFIGKSYVEAKENGDLDLFQYRIEAGSDGNCSIVVGRRRYSPTDITRFILAKIKEDAEANFNPINTLVSKAAIVVPSHFNLIQRRETEQAARMAGFREVHLISLPTAAALAYDLRVERKDRFLMVIDTGVGTFDVTVARVYLDHAGVLQTKHRGHGGNTGPAGLDIDKALYRYLIQKHRLNQIDSDSRSRASLLTEVERAKISLSTNPTVRLKLTCDAGSVDILLQRSAFEEAVKPVLEQCLKPIEVALSEARVKPADLAHVLLIGGPSKIPAFRRMIKLRFRENSRLVQQIETIDHDLSSLNPTQAVACGAVLSSLGAEASEDQAEKDSFVADLASFAGILSIIGMGLVVGSYCDCLPVGIWLSVALAPAYLHLHELTRIEDPPHEYFGLLIAASLVLFWYYMTFWFIALLISKS